MSVLGNLRYGLRRAHAAVPQIRLESIIELMGVGGLLHRSPGMLSGGERQRVAIGRAILSQPKLLLMDEPLSALDRDAKNEILFYLERLSETYALPIIYVSHDFSEIERLADYLVLMEKGGRVRAFGELNALLTDLSLPLARQPEASVVLAVTVAHYDEIYDLTACALGGATIFVPGQLGPQGSRHRLRVLASDVSLVNGKAPDTSILNILPAKILSTEMASANQVLVLLGLRDDESNGRLIASITRKSWDHLALQPGDEVLAQVKGMALADAR
jgi:molybdate transport system ATP-binding protein